MSKLITLFVLTVSLVVLTGCVPGVSDDSSNSTSSNTSASRGDFTIDSIEYNGNNTWDYVVAGTLPTPCHTFRVDVLVAESFPEQVTLKPTIIEPDPDTACIQVISEQVVSGTFSASEGAKVSLGQ